MDHSRDFERTPMQWSSGKNAGFTKGNNTWLQLNPNFTDLNVQVKPHYFFEKKNVNLTEFKLID
jgi:glycosidase